MPVKSSKSFMRSIPAVLIIILACAPPLFPQDKNLLSGPFTTELLKTSILAAKDWHPYPKQFERAAWSQIPEAVRNGTIAKAEKLLHGSWQIPKATDFLEY